MKPLVSILIPAYNAEETIAESIESAVAQTWPRKEVIIANDGSTDRTGEVARRFSAGNVKVVTTENRGLSGAENTAYRNCQGDFMQCLDADDILAPDKIEKQLAALQESDSRRTLLSSAGGYFYHSIRRAWFTPNSLWQDLFPVDWLLNCMGQNLRMPNLSWLVSRELAEAAGPWRDDLWYDQDGEYFCRVVAASVGTRFVPTARGFVRKAPSLNRVSYIGASDKKKEALLLSMKLHIRCLRSLEESERVRKACLAYMQNWYQYFYPERPDLGAELQSLAAELQGRLEIPRLRWKYAWLRPILGWKTGRDIQTFLPMFKAWCVSVLEKFGSMLAATRQRNAP